MRDQTADVARGLPDRVRLNAPSDTAVKADHMDGQSKVGLLPTFGWYVPFHILREAWVNKPYFMVWVAVAYTVYLM